MADPLHTPDTSEEEDPKAHFVGDLLPSNAAEDEGEPLTWEQIDAAADQALSQGDQLARKNAP